MWNGTNSRCGRALDRRLPKHNWHRRRDLGSHTRPQGSVPTPCVGWSPSFGPEPGVSAMTGVQPIQVLVVQAGVEWPLLAPVPWLALGMCFEQTILRFCWKQCSELALVVQSAAAACLAHTEKLLVSSVCAFLTEYVRRKGVGVGERVLAFCFVHKQSGLALLIQSILAASLGSHICHVDPYMSTI